VEPESKPDTCSYNTKVNSVDKMGAKEGNAAGLVQSLIKPAEGKVLSGAGEKKKCFSPFESARSENVRDLPFAGKKSVSERGNKARCAWNRSRQRSMLGITDWN